MNDLPIAFQAWETLAEAYSAKVETKAHNALYERPATLSLLPPIEKLMVLDAGCGPGVYARWLVDHGAQVVGFDISPSMLNFARQRLGDEAQIVPGDLRKPLTFLEDRSFDLVLSSLALDYVEDWDLAFGEFFRVLRPSGILVFSVGYPMPDYLHFRENANYYEIEMVEETWRGFGFEIKVPFYRRPFSAMINPLLSAGFRLEKILEPRPLEAFREKEPDDYDKLMKEPGFIFFRAVKLPGPRSPN